jgi:hypothetical protein
MFQTQFSLFYRCLAKCWRIDFTPPNVSLDEAGIWSFDFEEIENVWHVYLSIFPYYPSLCNCASGFLLVRLKMTTTNKYKTGLCYFCYPAQLNYLISFSFFFLFNIFYLWAWPLCTSMLKVFNIFYLFYF